jgi:hypothetical protein
MLNARRDSMPLFEAIVVLPKGEVIRPPLSPTPLPVLTVPGAAGVKANS